MHTQGVLGFRDFSSLSPAKENRRQLGNPACRISSERQLCSEAGAEQTVAQMLDML